jgi:hypothetical protein
MEHGEKLQAYRVYLTESELDYLADMAREGGFETTSRLFRNILAEIIRDDKATHDEGKAA